MKVNGITFNSIAGRPLVFDPAQAQGLAGQDPAADRRHRRSTRASSSTPCPRATRSRWRTSTSRRTRARTPKPATPRARWTSQGDDGANVQGFELEGRGQARAAQGRQGAAERQHRAAEGVRRRRGQRPHRRGRRSSPTTSAASTSSGIQIKAPLVFIGKVEVHNLFLNFTGERNGDAKATCNAELARACAGRAARRRSCCRRRTS